MPLIKARSGGAGPIWLGVKCKTPADYQSAGVFFVVGTNRHSHRGDCRKSFINPLTVIQPKEAVAKSVKALNHKDTKAQRKIFLPAGRSLSPEETLCLRVFVVPFF